MADSSAEAGQASADTAYVQVRGVSHVYDAGDEQVEALADIDLSIEQGQIVSIVGTSGCGKSTLLRILSGLMAPTAGHIEIDGQVITGISDHVGLVFQNYDDTLLKWRNVYENVAIGAEMGGTPKDQVEERTLRYLELVGLEEFKHANPQELSGGMKQRVQVARILAYDPDVLLCDEPFGALDAQTKERLQDEFLEILQEDPTTTVFVTHDIEEAIYLGDKVSLFTARNPGRIGHSIDIDFERPRYPKTAFEVEHSEAVTEIKKSVQERMEL